MLGFISRRSLIAAVVVIFAFPAQGCGLLLGLDEYGPAPERASGSGGAGGMMAGSGGGQGGAGMGSGGQGGQGGGGDPSSWSRLFGPTNDQIGNRVVVDNDSNVIVAGHFNETIEIDSTTHVSAGSSDFFLIKLSSTGDVLWSKRFGNAMSNISPQLAVDSGGNIILSGTFDGSLDVGGGSLPGVGAGDVFVAKFNGNGEHTWSKSYGDAKVQRTKHVAVDTAGNVILTGEFDGGVTFGGATLTSSGLYDIFVAKLASADGSHMWSKRLGDEPNKPSGEQLVDDIAIDSSDSLLLTGRFSESLAFGGQPLVSKGGHDNFVLKVDSEGAVSWGRAFGNSLMQSATSITVDASGSAILSGRLVGAMDFGGGEISAGGGSGAFAAKLSAIGNHVWSLPFVTGTSVYVSGSAVDAKGQVLVAGSYTGPVEIGSETISGNGIFIATLNANGAFVNRRLFGDSESQSILDVAVDPGADQTIITGQTFTTIDFGQGPLSHGGDFDAFVAKLSSSSSPEP